MGRKWTKEKKMTKFLYWTQCRGTIVIFISNLCNFAY